MATKIILIAVFLPIYYVTWLLSPLKGTIYFPNPLWADMTYFD